MRLEPAYLKQRRLDHPIHVTRSWGEKIVSEGVVSPE